MTGELKDSVANMIGHVPFDYKNRRWMKPGALTRCVCNVPSEKLCELVPSGEVIGKITKDASEKTGIPMGLPLIATGSDKGCETIGMSVVKSNRAAISFGTTSTLQMAVKNILNRSLICRLIRLFRTICSIPNSRSIADFG